MESIFNKRATFDYEILEKFEAGFALTGHETKSIKSGHLNLAGSQILIRGGEAYLVNADIPSFQPQNAPTDYSATRARKLLLNQKEINYLAQKVQEGLKIVPIKVYSKKNWLKVEIALARSKKKGDKRATIQKREVERDIRRVQKTRVRK